MSKAAQKRSFTKDNPPRFSRLVVHPKHGEGCTHLDAYDSRCKCERSALFTPGSFRLLTHKRSVKAAEDWAKDWVERHDPSKLKSEITHMPILDAIDACIRAFRLEKKLRPDTVKQMNSVRNSIKKLVSEWNGQHEKAHHLVYIHESTADHIRALVRIWDRDMPTKTVHTKECDRSSSCKCKKFKPEMSRNKKRNRLSFLVRVFERAFDQKWMEKSGRLTIKNRQGKQVVINESNPAAYVEATGPASIAEDYKTVISERLFDAYMFALEVYCAQRECKHMNPNLFSRARTYFRFLKRVGFAKTDGYTCRKDSVKQDENGWYVEIDRLKSGEEAKVYITDAFHDELMNVPDGMEPTHPDFIFFSGYDFDKASADAHDEIKKDPELTYERAYLDALNQQQTDAADTMEKLWAKLTDMIPRDLLYAECKTDKKTGILVEPTLHCFRYGYNNNYRRVSKQLGLGDDKAGAARSLGHTKAVAEKHYEKETQEDVANMIRIQKRLAEEQEVREALAIHELVKVSVKQ